MKLVRDLEKIASQRYFCPYEISSAYVSLKDHDKAFHYLGKGIDERADCMAWLKVEPWMDPIRQDPRYAEILSQMGLPADPPR